MDRILYTWAAQRARQELEKMMSKKMNSQNRTADGRIASKKESMRSDCIEMVARYRAQAKAALQAGRKDRAQALVNKCSQLRAAFFADFGEPA